MHSLLLLVLQVQQEKADKMDQYNKESEHMKKQMDKLQQDLMGKYFNVVCTLSLIQMSFGPQRTQKIQICQRLQAV